MASARSVVTATAEDEEELAEMIADAFADLPPSRYLVPDENERRPVLARTIRLDLEDVRVGGGLIRTIADREAAALWSYHPGKPDPVPELDERLMKAAGEAAGRFFVFYTTLDARRRKLLGDRPHWHLSVLAVRRDQQRRGLGSKLLLDHVSRFDPLGEPVYLEAATEELRETYRRRFGFQPASDPVVLGGGVTRMFPMIREAS